MVFYMMLVICTCKIPLVETLKLLAENLKLNGYLQNPWNRFFICLVKAYSLAQLAQLVLPSDVFPGTFLPVP